MTLKEMIQTLRSPESERVEVRNENNYEMFTANALSEALTPYEEWEVTNWFPRAAPFKSCTFTVCVEAPKQERIEK